MASHFLLALIRTGSSTGRGTRAAAWFQDYVEDSGDSDIRSVVLDGGLKAWIQGGDAYTSLMSEFDLASVNNGIGSG